jgi:fibrillarin-like pre-rRNA processing protein
MKEVFPGVYAIEKRLAVENTAKNFFGEQVVKVSGKEYKIWDPYRSKVAAAIAKGLKIFPITKGTKVLYLGAAHGFTCSFLSSIVGDSGIIYAVEFSDRCFNELLPVTEKYKNIMPILADARLPENFAWVEEVDVVYCDIAQPDATEIAIRDCKQFLKKGGYLMFAIKTQSVDVTASAKKTVEQEIKKIKDAGFEIVDWKMLEPFEEKHGFVVARM